MTPYTADVGVALFYQKNPHSHSGFGHGHWVTGSLVARSHGHKVFGWSCLVSFLDPNNPSMDCFSEAICAGVVWQWKRSLLGLFGSGSDPCWGWKQSVLGLTLFGTGSIPCWGCLGQGMRLESVHSSKYGVYRSDHALGLSSNI